MKKILGYFQKNIIVGMMLLCNVAVLPNDLNPVLSNTTGAVTENAELGVGEAESPTDPPDRKSVV